jgi:hypothetical protein
MFDTFEEYLRNVKIRSSEFTYSKEQISNNIDYFRRCREAHLSPYKALVFLYDYLKGDYDI